MRKLVHVGPGMYYGTPVCSELFQVLAHMDALLHIEYGADFSYVIYGKGEILGASNQKYGVILPTRRD